MNLSPTEIKFNDRTSSYSGEDAYKKIRAGATLVQLYTAFAYGGPALIPQIKVLSFTYIRTLKILEGDNIKIYVCMPCVMVIDINANS